MSRIAIGVALLAANTVLVMWYVSQRPGAMVGAFSAVIAAILVGAIVQRIVLRDQRGWRARLHLAVVVAAIVAFDAVLLAATLFRGR